jgi:hypothetical protein
MMRRIAVLLALCTVGAAAALPALAADGPVQQFRHDVTLGFYRGDVVSYLDFGPVKLARGNRVAPLWVVTNCVEAQRNIVGTVPGRRGCSPLWAVRTVTWTTGATPRVLRSKAGVLTAQRAGEVAVRAMPTVLNRPVL